MILTNEKIKQGKSLINNLKFHFIDSSSENDSLDEYLAGNSEEKEKVNQLNVLIKNSKHSLQDRRIYQNRKSALRCRLKKQRVIANDQESLYVTKDETE